MLTIQLYGLAENPKTQLLKINLLDALVELTVSFSFVQISTIDAFLEQKLSEIPCLMVNGGLIPSSITQSKTELSQLLQSLDVPLASPNILSVTDELPPHAGAHPYPLPAKDQGPLRARRRIGQAVPRPVNQPPITPFEDPEISSPSEFPRRAG